MADLGRALLAVGFEDRSRAAKLLESPELAEIDQQQLLGLLRRVPDPDQALILLIRLIERSPQPVELFTRAGETRAGAQTRDTEGGASAQVRLLALLRLLGASEALGEFLIRRPENLDVFLEPGAGGTGPNSAVPALEQLPAQIQAAETADPVGEPEGGVAELTRLLLAAVGADPEQDRPVAAVTGKDAAVALRTEYRRQLIGIAVADLMSQDPEAAQPVVSCWLADLAAAALESGLAVARAELGDTESGSNFTPRQVDSVDFVVIAMGKTGGRELNYISDVDVIFAHELAQDPADPELTEEQAHRIANELAHRLTTVIQGGAAPEPGLWEVDANLRPEGKDGALSRTVASHRQYYQRWAHTWEFQAQVKARPVAGAIDTVGAAYLTAIQPMVWQASGREGFVQQVHAMRRRVVDNIARKERDRELKLGPGGLREIEFPAQLLQLVHGRTDASLHVRSTEQALRALEAGGYIGRADAGKMIENYRFLRLLEHRIQLVHMRRTHLMPEKEEDLRVLARAVRPLNGGHSAVHDAQSLINRWKATVRSVTGLFEQIFYRPLLPATAALPEDQARLAPEAAKERLAALGYRDPNGAIRHIGVLTEGVSRRAALQRQLLPAMLGWFAEGSDPDGGLLAFRKLSESIGTSGWYLRMLRDSSDAAERLCTVLSSSRYIADMLEHSPEAVAWLDRDAELQPVPLDALIAQMRSIISRHADTEEAVRLVRMIRRREVLRTAISDALGLIDQGQVSAALADADQALVVGCLEIIGRDEAQALAEHPGFEFAVIAMGRQGGREAGYGSDLDAMFVYRAPEEQNDAQELATRIAKTLTQLVKMPVKPAIPMEQCLVIDADLRPEGKQGPLVRSLDSYRSYYENWAEIWEIQALILARPIAGSGPLQHDFADWADSVRYGPTVMNEARLKEIQRMKARVEAERLPRGADPARHLKLGRGSISDVEWLVETYQLRYGSEHQELQGQATLPALRALGELGYLEAEEVEWLESAWKLSTRIRSANTMWNARGSDVLPTNRDELEAVARWCGYPPGQAGQLEEDYLRITRHARQIFERRFYGLEETENEG